MVPVIRLEISGRVACLYGNRLIFGRRVSSGWLPNVSLVGEDHCLIQFTIQGGEFLGKKKPPNICNNND